MLSAPCVWRGFCHIVPFWLLTRSARCAAGRHDLATAVKQHGGFRAVAEALDRKLLYQWSTTETDMRRLEAAVRECQASVGLRADEMPSRSHLEQVGIPHVVRWVVVAGGFSKVRKCVPLCVFVCAGSLLTLCSVLVCLL